MSPDSADPLLRGKKILLIEEDDQLYRALADGLADAGAVIFGGVSSLSNGIGLLPLLHLDAAIVDASRPRSVLGIIRELQQHGVPCVIVATQPLRSVRAATVRYLAKPFSEQQLLASVSTVLSWRDYADTGSDGSSTPNAPIAVAAPSA